MPFFRKKPVVIEAIQFTGTNAIKIWDFMGRQDFYCNDLVIHRPLRSNDNVTLSALESSLDIDPGDWIIKDANGEFHKEKPDIFEATYEPASESEEG